MRWLASLVLAASTPSTLFTLPPEHRLVEGIASNGDAVFVSSVFDKVIRVQMTGMMGALTLPGDVANPLGLAWDAGRKWLWIATDCPDMPGVAPCESGALIAIDMKGRVRARLRPDVPFHGGDVSVGGGSVFVSDSRNGAVYHLLPRGRNCCPWSRRASASPPRDRPCRPMVRHWSSRITRKASLGSIWRPATES
jgi:hypothetical protein